MGLTGVGSVLHKFVRLSPGCRLEADRVRVQPLRDRSCSGRSWWGQAATVRRSRSARPAPKCVLRSAQNANATMTQPKPLTPDRGSHAIAHARVVHGSRKNPMIGNNQLPSNAAGMRSVNSQTRNSPNRGEMAEARTIRHPQPMWATLAAGCSGKRQNSNEW